MRKLLIAFVTLTAAFGGAGVGGASTGAIVGGGYVSILPTTFTHVAVNRHHPREVRFSLIGGSVWDGSFTGETYYTAEGTLDVVSGDAAGTIDERLVGVVTATHRRGVLHVAGTFRVDGATDALIVRETILGGTGPFTRSKGWLEFDAFILPTSTGYGGYHGVWYRG